MSFVQESRRIASIRKRILLIALMGILITGLVASLSTSIPFYFSARDNLEQITLASVQSKANALDNLFEKYQGQARQFTGRSEIRIRLEMYVRGEMSREALTAFTEPRLEDAMRLSNEIIGLVRLGPEGEVLVKIGEIPNDSIINEQEKNFSPISSQPIYTLIKLNNTPVIRVAANIYSKQGVVIGQDVLYFNSLILSEELKEKLQLDKETNLYLAHLLTQKRLIFSSETETLSLKQDISNEKLNYLGQISECGQCALRPEGGCKNIIFLIPLKHSDWSLVAEIPINNFYYAIRQQLFWPLLAIFTMLVLAAFVISKALHPLTRRLAFQAKELEHSSEELRLVASVFEGTREAIAVTDEKMHLIKVNSAFTQITGFKSKDVLNKDLQDLFYKKKAIEKLQLKIHQSLEVKSSWQGEIWYQHQNGELLPVLQSISALLDDDGQVTNYIHIFNDISESKAVEDRINYLAHYDQLTDLPNRTLLNRRIKKAVDKASRTGQGLAILFMDLDHFKEVNDTLGHPIGDLLLQAVGQRLKARLREQDTLGRLGGDEFLAMLDHAANLEASGAVAQKIIDSLIQPFAIDGNQIQIGVSIGIAIFPKDGDTADLLIKNADIAMYRAKEAGRNTFRYFSEPEDV